MDDTEQSSQWTRRRFFFSAAAATAAVAALGPAAAGQSSATAAASTSSHSSAGLDGTASPRQTSASPFLVGEVAVASGSTATTAVVPVTTATATGDAIVLCPATTGGNTITKVTDTSGNSYQLVTSGTNGARSGWAYVALNPKPLTASDTITVTFSSGAAHNVVAVGVPGATAIDTKAAAAASGDSATPSVTTGTLASANSALVAMAVTGDSAGPVAWSNTPFGPIEVYGGGTVTMVALSQGSKTPGGKMVAGGDVEGYFVTDNAGGTGNYGDQWTVSNTGVYGQYWRQCACIAWSDIEEDTVYSCTGNAGSPEGGGFLVSTDGGTTWGMRSTQVQFSGNHGASPLPSGGWPRSTGNLLAQDAANSILYTGTYSGGVFRSETSTQHPLPGESWTAIGLTPVVVSGVTQNYYCRSLVMDPSRVETLYASTYDYTGNGKYGHVWVTTNAHATAPAWTQLALSPAIVEELTVVDGYLYAACGSSGLYRAQLPVTATTKWESLNGTFINTSQSYWDSIAGYVDSAGTHHIIAYCDDPVKVTLPSGAVGYRSLVELAIPSTGSPITYTDLSTNTANIQLATIPPSGQPWWHYHANSNYPDWLGGGKWTNGHVVIDTSPARGVAIYVTGDNGFYRSTNGGKDWTIAINGMPLFSGRSVAVDPADPQHLVWGDSDWNSWDVDDGTGYAAQTTPVPAGSLEGYALAFDPDPNPPAGTNTIFLGAGTKYTNTDGFVYARTSAEPPTTWTDTKLAGSMPGGYVPIGLAVVRDSATPSNQYVIAAAETNGLWLMKNGGSWTQVSKVVGKSKQFTSYMPFASVYGSAYSQYVYALDRASGVYRGSGYGQAWTTSPIYACNTNSDSRTGFLALNPAVDDELWVSNLSGLFKIRGASAFNSGTPTAVPLPGGMTPGSVAFAADGTVYCLGLGDSAAHPDTILFRSVNGGASWQNVSGPGPGIAANASAPQNMVVAADGVIYIASGGNIVAYGTPAAGWVKQGIDLHSGADEHTSAAAQVVTSTAPVTATGQIAGGEWLMLVVPLEV